MNARFSTLGRFALATWFVSHSALASSTFPGAVQAELQLSITPPCTLCHETLSGGFGTVTKPFGRALLKAGATAADTAALRTALRALETAETDSDSDGVPDTVELMQGSNPNLADVTEAGNAGAGNVSETQLPMPLTGCSIVAAGRRSSASLGPDWLTARRPSPTVGPISRVSVQSRRISGDAFLVCGLGLGFFSRRLRLFRKRVASAAV